MKKIRVYELSKKLNISNKELIEFLTKKFNLEVKSHSSSLDEDIERKVVESFQKKTEPPKPSSVKPKEHLPPRPMEKPAEAAVKKPAEVFVKKQEAKPAPLHSDKRPEVKTFQSRPSPQGPQGQGQRPQGQRPQGQRPQGQRPQGQRPQGQGQPPRKDSAVAARKKPSDFARPAEKRGEIKPMEHAKSPSSNYQQKQKFAGEKPRKSFRPGSSAFDDGSTAKMFEKIEIRDDKADEGFTPHLQTRTFPRPMERSKKGKKGRSRGIQHTPQVTKKESVQKWLELPETITVGELAQKMDISSGEIIKTLMSKGIMATINQTVNFDEAAQIAKQFGFKIEKMKVEEEEVKEQGDDPRMLVSRPPVVTVLGHVDHGKTSLLDAIRNTKVTATESGGITQNIGAYVVNINDRDIVFVDTPGHEAFTAMRARGAKVTDIAVLVVAADDGVMPQTLEAINHAKAAKVPIIVAINKIDKPEANVDRVKTQLSEHDLVAEDWGGETVMVAVSARNRTGIEDLLEMIILVADMQELKANPRRLAIGSIIESKLDKGLGSVATVIVQNGTLRLGDAVLVGNEFGKIRYMTDFKGKPIKKALPSYPAEIVGLSGIPQAGDRLEVFADEKTARTISDNIKLQVRATRLQASAKTSLEDLFRQMQEGITKDLNIIIKVDVNGAIEPLVESLTRLSNNEVKINVIHSGIGAISETDVMLATASDAIIIGFNVRPDPLTKKLSEQEKVDIRLYTVIYNIIDDIKAAMTGLLEPEFEEVYQGRAEVRNVFKVSKIGTIAGSYVLDGKIARTSSVRVLRDNVVIYEGKMDSLRRFKDDVKEVNSGFECGILITKLPIIQPGDIIESFVTVEKKREMV